MASSPSSRRRPPRPQAEAAEIDALRRAVGLVEPFHVAPHVTLVPAVNVAEPMSRTCSASCGGWPRRPAMELDVGPPPPSCPETPTLHLAVAAQIPGAELLRGACAAGRSTVPTCGRSTTPPSASADRADAAAVTTPGRAYPALVGRLGAPARAAPPRTGSPRHGQAHWVAIRENRSAALPSWTGKRHRARCGRSHGRAGGRRAPRNRPTEPPELTPGPAARGGRRGSGTWDRWWAAAGRSNRSTARPGERGAPRTAGARGSDGSW